MVSYRDDAALGREQFIELYYSCSLGARRPLEDLLIVEAMITHANLTITAWDGALLVGIARTLTDFHYIAYLADLAVRETHQKSGIGIELIRQTRQKLGPRCGILLRAAPAAKDYYRHIGFTEAPHTWTLDAGRQFPQALST